MNVAEKCNDFINYKRLFRFAQYAWNIIKHENTRLIRNSNAMTLSSTTKSLQQFHFLINLTVQVNFVQA